MNQFDPFSFFLSFFPVFPCQTQTQLVWGKHQFCLKFPGSVSTNTAGTGSDIIKDIQQFLADWYVHSLLWRLGCIRSNEHVHQKV